jgi:hypothetical protein
MITPTSAKQSVRNTSASFGSLYALRTPNNQMITPMSVNNSIVNAIITNGAAWQKVGRGSHQILVCCALVCLNCNKALLKLLLRV